MRELRTDVDVLVHAINDGINAYIRDVLIPRGLVDPAAWAAAGPDSDLLLSRYEVAAAVAKRWEVSWHNDEA